MNKQQPNMIYVLTSIAETTLHEPELFLSAGVAATRMKAEYEETLTNLQAVGEKISCDGISEDAAWIHTNVSHEWEITSFGLCQLINTQSNGWYLTNAETYQYCKKLDNTTYAFVDTLYGGEGDDHFVLATTINLNDEEETDIESSFASLCTTPLAAYREEYGEDANAFIAQCMFESIHGDSACDHVARVGSKQAAALIVHAYITGLITNF